MEQTNDSTRGRAEDPNQQPPAGAGCCCQVTDGRTHRPIGGADPPEGYHDEGPIIIHFQTVSLISHSDSKELKGMDIPILLYYYIIIYKY